MAAAAVPNPGSGRTALELCLEGGWGAAWFPAGRAESDAGSTDHPPSPSYLFYTSSYLFKASIVIYLSPKEQRPLRSVRTGGRRRSSQPLLCADFAQRRGQGAREVFVGGGHGWGARAEGAGGRCPPLIAVSFLSAARGAAARPARTPRPCWRACSGPRTPQASTSPAPTRPWSHASVSGGVVGRAHAWHRPLPPRHRDAPGSEPLRSRACARLLPTLGRPRLFPALMLLVLLEKTFI